MNKYLMLIFVVFFVFLKTVLGQQTLGEYPFWDTPDRGGDNMYSYIKCDEKVENNQLVMSFLFYSHLSGNSSIHWAPYYPDPADLNGPWKPRQSKGNYEKYRKTIKIKQKAQKEEKVCEIYKNNLYKVFIWSKNSNLINEKLINKFILSTYESLLGRTGNSPASFKLNEIKNLILATKNKKEKKYEKSLNSCDFSLFNEKGYAYIELSNQKRKCMNKAGFLPNLGKRKKTPSIRKLLAKPPWLSSIKGVKSIYPEFCFSERKNGHIELNFLFEGYRKNIGMRGFIYKENKFHASEYNNCNDKKNNKFKVILWSKGDEVEDLFKSMKRGKGKSYQMRSRNGNPDFQKSKNLESMRISFNHDNLNQEPCPYTYFSSLTGYGYIQIVTKGKKENCKKNPPWKLVIGGKKNKKSTIITVKKNLDNINDVKKHINLNSEVKKDGNKKIKYKYKHDTKEDILLNNIKTSGDFIFSVNLKENRHSYSPIYCEKSKCGYYINNVDDLNIIWKGQDPVKIISSNKIYNLHRYSKVKNKERIIKRIKKIKSNIERFSIDDRNGLSIFLGSNISKVILDPSFLKIRKSAGDLFIMDPTGSFAIIDQDSYLQKNKLEKNWNFVQKTIPSMKVIPPSTTIIPLKDSKTNQYCDKESWENYYLIVNNQADCLHVESSQEEKVDSKIESSFAPLKKSKPPQYNSAPFLDSELVKIGSRSFHYIPNYGYIELKETNLDRSFQMITYIGKDKSLIFSPTVQKNGRMYSYSPENKKQYFPLYWKNRKKTIVTDPWYFDKNKEKLIKAVRRKKISTILKDTIFDIFQLFDKTKLTHNDLIILSKMINKDNLEKLFNLKRIAKENGKYVSYGEGLFVEDPDGKHVIFKNRNIALELHDDRSWEVLEAKKKIEPEFIYDMKIFEERRSDKIGKWKDKIEYTISSVYNSNEVLVKLEKNKIFQEKKFLINKNSLKKSIKEKAEKLYNPKGYWIVIDDYKNEPALAGFKSEGILGKYRKEAKKTFLLDLIQGDKVARKNFKRYDIERNPRFRARGQITALKGLQEPPDKKKNWEMHIFVSETASSLDSSSIEKVREIIKQIEKYQVRWLNIWEFTEYQPEEETFYQQLVDLLNKETSIKSKHELILPMNFSKVQLPL